MNNPWSKLTKRAQYRIILTVASLFTITFLIWLFLPPTKGEIKYEILSYTEFIARVEKLEINKVVITRDAILGVLPDEKPFKVMVITDHVKPVEDLKKYNVNITFPEPDYTGDNRVVFCFLSMLPIFGIWGYFFFKGIGPKGEIYLKFWQTRAWVARQSAKNNKVTFSDVAGIDEAKDELQEVVEFLKNPKKFQVLGGKIPKGVLMVGQPGNGKTLLAKAVAGEAGVEFFEMAGSDFVEMYVGVGAGRVRKFFDKGKAHSPCVLFIDEIDALGGKRGLVTSGGDREYQQTLNALLVEMDGFEKSPGVVVMAATNRPDMLDKALLRPGRFDRHVAVHSPSAKGREAILEVHTRKVPLADDVDLKEIAQTTQGYSGADLANLVNEATLSATRDARETVTREDFMTSKDKILLGPERKFQERSMEDIDTSRFHESGHAFLAARLKYSERIDKVSIASRGFTGGVTQFVPSESETMKLKKINASIVVAMGGRVAERLFLGDISTGAQNDFEQANKYARAMVCEWGMSKLGPISTGSQTDLVYGRTGNSGTDHSESFKKEIDDTVCKIIGNAQKWATKIIERDSDFFNKLADKFTAESKVIDGKEIYELVEGLEPIEINSLEDDEELETLFRDSDYNFEAEM